MRVGEGLVDTCFREALYGLVGQLGDGDDVALAFVSPTNDDESARPYRRLEDSTRISVYSPRSVCLPTKYQFSWIATVAVTRNTPNDGHQDSAGQHREQQARQRGNGHEGRPDGEHQAWHARHLTNGYRDAGESRRRSLRHTDPTGDHHRPHPDPQRCRTIDQDSHHQGFGSPRVAGHDQGGT